MIRPDPHLVVIWLQSAGLVVFALGCWLIVSIGIIAAAFGWLLMLPMRLIRKAKGESRKAEGKP